MRDVIVVSMVLLAALAALRRPWIGVVLWAWLSLMNPHRYCYGFAYDAPVAQIAMACTLLGMVFNQDQIRSPLRGTPVVWLVIFMLWITLSWRMGVDPTGDVEQWSKVMKIDFAILLSLALLRTKKQLMTMMSAAAPSASGARRIRSSKTTTNSASRSS
jgi:putative inorganic carbon (hco3(-)) transporter